MNKSYPWITLGCGLSFSLILLKFGPENADGPRLPLLTALLMSEVGLVITIIGGAICIKEIRQKNAYQKNTLLLLGNLLLAIFFFWLGLELWPGLQK